MEDYGFILVTKDEAKHMNLPNGTGMFSELFTLMEVELKSNPKNEANYRKAKYMTPEEKRISFMNRYFVFKKIRDVDVKKMSHVILKEEELEEKIGEDTLRELEEELKKKDSEEKDEQVAKKRKLVLKKTELEVEEKKPIVSISKEKFSIQLKR